MQSYLLQKIVSALILKELLQNERDPSKEKVERLRHQAVEQGCAACRLVDGLVEHWMTSPRATNDDDGVD